MNSIRTAVFAGLLVVLVVACTATQIDLPPLAEARSDKEVLPGKVVWHDLLTDTPEQTRHFYRELFGWEFRSLPGDTNYQLIYHRGRPIGGLVDQNRLPVQEDISQWVVVLSVTDVNTAVDKFSASGGTVFTPPTSLGSRGRLAVVADAQGAVLALLESGGRDPADSDSLPAEGEFLWNELWTDNVDLADDFYGKIAPYSEETRDMDFNGQHIEYRVMTSGGRPRLGIRSNPLAQFAPQWVSYLRVGDTGVLEDLLARVESLGGSVLIPATARPAGGEVAVIADPSGAGIALQTWPPSAETGSREAAR
jgi:predicted enzyme related to lactoylglutathione lyase